MIFFSSIACQFKFVYIKLDTHSSKADAKIWKWILCYKRMTVYDWQKTQRTDSHHSLSCYRSLRSPSQSMIWLKRFPTTWLYRSRLQPRRWHWFIASSNGKLNTCYTNAATHVVCRCNWYRLKIIGTCCWQKKRPVTRHKTICELQNCQNCNELHIETPS
jgi:hypothetical protein